MNKNLFRLSSCIILFNILFSLLNLRGVISYLDFTSIGVVLVSLADVAFLVLLIITAVGLWKMKNWSRITLWLSVGLTAFSKILSFLMLVSSSGARNDSFFNGFGASDWYSLIFGVVYSVYLYLIIAIFISKEFKTRNTLNNI
jgi:hypothetical protein